jgi:hypothetical protein
MNIGMLSDHPVDTPAYAAQRFRVGEIAYIGPEARPA